MKLYFFNSRIYTLKTAVCTFVSKNFYSKNINKLNYHVAFLTFNSIKQQKNFQALNRIYIEMSRDDKKVGHLFRKYFCVLKYQT